MTNTAISANTSDQAELAIRTMQTEINRAEEALLDVQFGDSAAAAERWEDFKTHVAQAADEAKLISDMEPLS